MSLAQTLKEQLNLARRQVIERFQSDGKPEALLSSLRKHVDVTLTQAWQHFEFPPSATLVAVGGYGRGELFPYSDVDVLILLESAPGPVMQQKLEQLVQTLWDIGLEIGHSIRTIPECLIEAAADITVQTSLLEARLTSPF